MFKIAGENKSKAPEYFRFRSYRALYFWIYPDDEILDDDDYRSGKSDVPQPYVRLGSEVCIVDFLDIAKEASVYN